MIREVKSFGLEIKSVVIVIRNNVHGFLHSNIPALEPGPVNYITIQKIVLLIIAVYSQVGNGINS